jgi:hypothetical protein
MATEGKALSRGCPEGSRPRLNNKRRGKFAFGLRSIAVARPCGTRSGLRWELADPEPDGLGRRVTRGLRWPNDAVTKVKTDFASAIIRQRPFRHRCAGGAGHRRRRRFTPSDAARGYRWSEGATRKDRSSQPAPRGAPPDSAAPDGVSIITDRMRPLARSGVVCRECNIAAAFEPQRRRIINQGGSIRYDGRGSRRQGCRSRRISAWLRPCA